MAAGGAGGGVCRHPHPRDIRDCGDLVPYPCTGDGVSSGVETAVPVVAGAAMRQRVVGTGNRAGFGDARLPVSAKRSYDLHGVLGGKTGVLAPRHGRRHSVGQTSDAEVAMGPGRDPGPPRSLPGALLLVLCHVPGLGSGGRGVVALELCKFCKHFWPEGFPTAGGWGENDCVVRLFQGFPPRNLGGGPCLWRRPRGRAQAPPKAAPMGQAQGPLRDEVPGVEPMLPRRSTHPTGGSKASSRRGGQTHRTNGRRAEPRGVARSEGGASMHSPSGDSPPGAGHPYSKALSGFPGVPAEKPGGLVPDPEATRD